MRTLKEYLERNNYSIVKSLAELLSISDQEAKNFYGSLSVYDEGAVIDALKDGASEDLTDRVQELFSKFRQTELGEGETPEEIDPNFDDVNDRFEIKFNNGKYDIHDHKTNSVVDTAHSGHEAHNMLYYWRQQGKKGVEEAKKSPADISKMAGKAQAGGYDMARELSKGQYQPKVVPNKKFKNDRQGDKARLKRGMFENSITPILVSENDEFKFKIVESSSVATQSNVQAIFESTVMISPMGGLSSVPGVGMSGLRRMAGIAPAEETPMAGENLQDLDCSDSAIELESNDVNDVLAMISQMDDMSKACLISLLTNPVAEEPKIDAEQLETVKCALRDFGCALQCWIEDSCGALDFLVPLVDALWVKYNEFCV